MPSVLVSAAVALLLWLSPAVADAGAREEAAKESPIEGTWEGTTSQSRKITIHVKDHALSRIRLEWEMTFDTPCPPPGSNRPQATRQGTAVMRFPFREPVKDAAFHTKVGIGRDLDASVDGTFADDGSAEGEIQLRSTEGSACKGSQKLTWTAKRRR